MILTYVLEYYQNLHAKINNKVPINIYINNFWFSRKPFSIYSVNNNFINTNEFYRNYARLRKVSASFLLSRFDKSL
jgi:hypothetical protein